MHELPSGTIIDEKDVSAFVDATWRFITAAEIVLSEIAYGPTKTTPEVSFEIQTRSLALEAQLERFIVVTTENDRSKRTKGLLKRAQQAWMRYREIHTEWVYETWIEGTIRSVLASASREQLTKQRLEALTAALEIFRK